MKLSRLYRTHRFETEGRPIGGSFDFRSVSTGIMLVGNSVSSLSDFVCDLSAMKIPADQIVAAVVATSLRLD